ncbi:STAS domain-containing protein [Paenibacillus alginolyticus]|uniref:STAS domain-containing protein n=1 Tax=Paenibacillus alginolyticus TaxID=59839 RepID=A0ABT4GQ24_9BACL|nr:STAS domain-containing protein [Paenibacillus alginolyticus]MCY9666527.1 STAS domain-containing protein [Paenibacillus alginolyticus]MCY9698299.1 STAS domain-containing protein [Paenibacillus alginolyticus]MEC0147722.1 STAS domain-containing protein [Paenibacillus alginolyticus]
MTLELTKEVIESTLFVSIIGLMDYSTLDQFHLEIPDSITKVVIDFNELEFIDSTGIGAILGVIHNARELNLNVEFMGLNETIIDLFETVGVFRVMEALKKRGNKDET